MHEKAHTKRRNSIYTYIYLTPPSVLAIHPFYKIVVFQCADLYFPDLFVRNIVQDVCLLPIPKSVKAMMFSQISLHDKINYKNKTFMRTGQQWHKINMNCNVTQIRVQSKDSLLV